VLSRLFSPEAFGFQGVFLSVIGMLAVGASLRYELAIMLPADEEEAAHVAALSVSILVLFSAAVGLIVLFAGDRLLARLGVTDAGNWVWLVPAGVFFSGLANILTYRSLRRGEFSLLSGVRVAGKTGQVVPAIGFGLLGLAGGGMLLFSSFLEWIVHSLLFALHSLRSGFGKPGSIGFRALLDAAKKYSRFPLYNTGSSLLNMVSLSIPTLLIAAFFGLRAGGFYTRALALVQVPAFMIGSSIRDVFFQRASAMHAAGEDLAGFADGVVERLTAFILLPMCMAALIGPELFVVVAGGEWYEAGVYSRLLAPWIFCSFLAFPLSVLLLVRGLQHIDLLYNVLFLAARLAVLFLGGAVLRDVRATILLFGLTGAAFNLWLILFTLRQCGASPARFFLHAGRFLLYNALPLAVTAGGKWALHLSPWPLVVLGCLASLLYLGMVARRDEEVRLRVLDIWRNVTGTRSGARERE
jgi:O-antigen/teichoic acid export membrane protein